MFVIVIKNDLGGEGIMWFIDFVYSRLLKEVMVVVLIEIEVGVIDLCFLWNRFFILIRFISGGILYYGLRYFILIIN